MNTQRAFGGLLLFVSLVAGLTGQELKLSTSFRADGSLAVRMENAREGDFTLVVLGMGPTALRLPGGHVLGVEPDMIVGWSFADSAGSSEILVKLTPLGRDLECLAQAVSVSPRLPLSDRDAIYLSNVQRVFVTPVADRR